MATDRKEYAESLGIRVDGRWSDERLEAEIAKAEADADKAPVVTPAPKVDGVMVRIVRDYWTDEVVDGDFKRVRAGTMIEVPPIQALDMIESGAAERVR